MNNTFEYAQINSSPTTVVESGKFEVAPGGKAVAITNGKAILPATAGDVPMGIVLLSNSEPIAEGTRLDIQIKDIGYWKAGAAIEMGDLLAVDTEGLCQKATTGQFVYARALNGATQKNDIIKIQIINAGFLK